MPKAFRVFVLVILVTGICSAEAGAQSWGAGGFSLYTMPDFRLGEVSGVVNNSGQVAGSTFNVVTRRWEAAIFDVTEGLQSLGSLGSNTYTSALAINNLGQITGYAENYSPTMGYTYDVFRSNESTLELLHETPGFAIAMGINDAGTVVGFAQTGAAIWQGGAVASPFAGYLYDINNAGIATGVNTTDGTAITYDTQTGLTTSIANNSYAVAINSSGVVGGWGYDGTTHRAFLHNAGMTTYFGSFLGSAAYDVDDGGRAVGYTHDQSGRQTAALWEGGQEYFLSAIAGDGWVFSHVQGISDDGRYMVANGWNENTGYVGAVLFEGETTVTPEPVTMTLIGTGLAGVAAARRRRRRAD